MKLSLNYEQRDIQVSEQLIVREGSLEKLKICRVLIPHANVCFAGHLIKRICSVLTEHRGY